jgi:tetratricopeptide (TPR) repeat protein
LGVLLSIAPATIYRKEKFMRLWVLPAFCLCAAAAFSQSQQVTPDEIAALEAKVAANADDIDARSRLIRAYSQAQPGHGEAPIDFRRKHVLWLIRHSPEAEILADPVSWLDPDAGPLSDPAGYEEAIAAWKQQLDVGKNTSRMLMRAAMFFQVTNRKLAYTAVAKGLRYFPQEHYFQQLRGMLDALTAAGVTGSRPYGQLLLDVDAAKSPEAVLARSVLVHSNQYQYLNGALNVMPQICMSVQPGSPPELTADLLAITEALNGNLRAIDSASLIGRSALSIAYAGAASRLPLEQRRPYLEKALANAVSERQKFYILGDLAESLLASGDRDKAAEEARRWLAVAPSFQNDRNYGNAIHKGNIILGRIALAAGNVPEARERLLAAGRTKGSPQPDFFGPDWQLAQDLLDHDERTVVLDYIKLCRAFWKGRETDLDAWASAIRAGAVPRLGYIAGTRPESELTQAVESGRAGASPAPTTEIAANPGLQAAEDDYRLGVGYRREKKLSDAETAFTHAIELRKDWIQARLARAQVRYEMQRFDDSIADLNEVIRLNPKHSTAYDLRGLAYSYSGDHERAIADYDKAIEIDPDKPNPYNNRGWAWLELGERSKALADLNRAIELNPSYQKALENRLRLYMETGQYALAVTDGESVLRLNPDASWARDRIAEARQRMGGGVVLLPAPKLLSPPPGAVFDEYPHVTMLTWSPVSGASRYEVEVDFSSKGKWLSETGGTRWLLPVPEPPFRFNYFGLLPGRWRVRAIDPDGQPGTESEWREFRHTR